MRKPSQRMTHLWSIGTLLLQHSLRLNQSVILRPNLPLVASTRASWFSRPCGFAACSCSQISLTGYGRCTRTIRRGVSPITNRNHHVPSIQLLGPRRDDLWSVPFLLHCEALPFPFLGAERLQLRRVLSTGTHQWLQTSRHFAACSAGDNWDQCTAHSRIAGPRT